MQSQGTTAPADATPEERKEYEQYLADHKEYTKYVTDATRELGNALRANPDDDNAYNAYRDAVKTYYTVQGGAKGELIPDENTVKNLIEGGKQFFGAQWESVKKAASGTNPLQALYGQQAGAAAAISDLPVMALQGISWLGEKALAEAGQYETAAERAAGRLRDTARYEAGIQKYLRPESEQGQGVFDISRTATGFALPVGGIAKGAKTVGVAAEAAETAAKAGKFAAMSEKAGGFAGRVVGRAGGPLGKAVGEEIGSGLGRAVGTTLEPVIDVTAGTAKGALTGGTVGGALGAGMVGAQEPVGTPVSQGVVPGALLGAGAGAVLGARGAIAERNAPKADFSRDFEGGGAVRLDNDRWAMETGSGVAKLSQQLEQQNSRTIHRDTVASHQNIQDNPKYGSGDPVIRFGYDPETRSFQTIVGDETKLDYVPRKRYVYQNVSPELAQRIIDSPSIQGEIFKIGDEGGYGIGYGRPIITDAQLNSLIDDINSGKIDFHPKWGFSKGSGTPPEVQFRKPERSKTEPTPAPAPKQSADFESKEWNPAFFDLAGRKAGEAYKGAKEVYGSIRENLKGLRDRLDQLIRPEDWESGQRLAETKEQRLRQSPLGAEALRERLARRQAAGERLERMKQSAADRAEIEKETRAQREADIEAALSEPGAESEVAARAQREADLKAAFDALEAQIAKDEEIRRSPQGAEALKSELAAQEEASKANAPEVPLVEPEGPSPTAEKRRADIEAAFANLEAQLAREEQIRQSPQGAKALAETLKKRAQDAERRQRYKEEGRVPLASFRKKAGVEFPPSEEALRQANVEATPAPAVKEPEVPFEASAIVPPGKTARVAKSMSQRMREIDAELPVATPKKRVELLNERLQIAAELGNEKAAEYLLGGKADEDKKLAVFHQKVRKLINEQGITNDPTYENAGEVKALRESGINFKNFNARGKTLDKLGEEIQRLATEAGRMAETAETTLGVSDVTNFIQEAFNAPRNVEPPRIGEPPIEGRAVKIKEPTPKKAKAESEEVTSIKDLRAQKKKAAIEAELAGKFAEPAPKGGKKVTLEQPAEKPAPAKASKTPTEPTTKAYEDEIYRISQVVPPGPISPRVVSMIADGVVKKGLLTADEVAGVKKISDINKLLQDKIDAVPETGSKQYWSAESLNLEAMKTTPSERAGAAPYTLIVDGKTKRYWSLPALDKVLKSISSEKPRVFKNADKGITINFDS